MDEINNPHDVYFRESFTRREIAQDFLRQHLPAELLEVVDLDSLEISEDSYVSKELRASYSDLVYRLQWRVPDQADPAAPERADPAASERADPAAPERVDPAAPEQASVQGARHPVAPSPSAEQGEAAQAMADQADVAALDPADAPATLDQTAAPATLALHVDILFEHKSQTDYWVLLQLLRYITLQGEAYRKQHPEAKTLPPVYPLVLYHGQRRWRMPSDFHALIRPLPEAPQTLCATVLLRLAGSLPAQ
ncbi:Rpn family recombination-promoting nuclease/putative transposase [Halochromatium roseum]|uniref:Rpn family recombination-promoting nuclease/putative transposase n=1 Tax=Halochromatium roseum TaxID=391920 RepID=UPI0019132840|nr:Rpn family recombination-promoting nuclease/putative transposase [Halochromatium roseum]MBK5937874.1 hypothetical protein [Halochromatium roseum]